MPKHNYTKPPPLQRPALTLHMTDIGHYDVNLCFEENRKKSTAQHNGIHHCNVTYLLVTYLELFGGMVTHGPLIDCLIDLSLIQCNDFHLIVLHT